MYLSLSSVLVSVIYVQALRLDGIVSVTVCMQCRVVIVYFSYFTATRKRSSSASRSNTRKSIYLWEFLFGLLEDDECTSVITWTNKSEGIFELKNTDELAKLWGTVKNRPKMDKNKLIRAIRTYYERGMLKKVRCLSLIFRNEKACG